MTKEGKTLTVLGIFPLLVVEMTLLLQQKQERVCFQNQKYNIKRKKGIYYEDHV
jgi:hypothetical protein